MTARMKWALIIGLSAVALGATIVVGVLAWLQYQTAQNQPSAVDTTADTQWAVGDRVVFRNTAAGQGYGLVSSVPLGDPGGTRAVTGVACDRVDADQSEFVCLRSERGIAPSYTGTIYRNDGSEVTQWPIPGIPSRTRFSPDGRLVATTAFVTGHSYATIGFSTETVIRNTSDDTTSGTLEAFALIINGQRVTPTDRNVWGVTFVDDNTFYATVGTGGTTYLVRGDLAERTLTSVMEGVECPSLSPDGTRIAFKRVTSGSGASVHWTPAILNIASGDVRVLTSETHNVDDQIAWLNDTTVLYGLIDDNTPGDTNIWSLAADGASDPKLFIEHAWSPSVVEAK